jgi:molybdopterin converting factor small subunit
VNVYLNDEDIRYLAKENTPTKDGDTISIVPSIAGGSGGGFHARKENF